MGSGCKELDNVLTLQERDPLVTVLGAEPVDDIAIGVLRARPLGSECWACEIALGQGVQRPRSYAFGADWYRLAGKGLLVGRHELRRPGQAGQGYFLEARSPEVPAWLAVAVEEAICVLRRSPHQTLSHSLPPDG